MKAGYTLIFIILLILTASCHINQTEKNKTLIIGDWYPIDETNMTSYSFYEDEICRKKVGFFEYIDSAGLTVEHPGFSNGEIKSGFSSILNNIMRYYRNHSCYKINDNYLEIFDPSIKTFRQYFIQFITEDTLLLTNTLQGNKEYYIRKKREEINTESLFDQIIFYYPSTNFSSSKYSSFQRVGLLTNYQTNKMTGPYMFGIIREEDFFALENLFKRANIQDYLEVYEKKRKKLIFSREEPCITFIKGDSMVTINNDLSFINSADLKNFYQAYFSTLFYSDNLHFEPEMGFRSNLFYFSNTYLLLDIYAGEKKVELSESERFYLAILINNGKKTDKHFQPKYAFKEKETGKEQILTDGQYFTYTDYEKKTVDIGFNFIKDNNLD